MASVPSAWPLQPEPFLSPQKISLGKLGGIRSPPGLKTDTGQDSPPGTGSPPGLARKLRLLLGMTRSQGPSATASTSATRGQAAGNGLHGHYKKSRLPQTSLHGQDRQDTLKLFLRARQDLKTMTLGTWHGTPGCDVDWIHGARVSGDRRAWVSGDPASIESEAGIESAAGRRAWGSGTPGTREPAGGLGIATAGGGQNTGTKIKIWKNEQNEVKGRRLWLGLVFCHGAHTRRMQEHADEVNQIIRQTRLDKN